MKKLTAEQRLVQAEEEYLLSHGWIKNIENLWTPDRRTAYVWVGDQVYRDNALEAQKEASEFPVR